MNIKEILLAGGSVKFAYKRKIDEWFGDIYIHLYSPSMFEGNDAEDVLVIAGSGGDFRFPISQVDEAIVKFLDLAYADENVGMFQKKAMANLKIKDYDGEPELTKLILAEARRLQAEHKKSYK